MPNEDEDLRDEDDIQEDENIDKSKGRKLKSLPVLIFKILKWVALILFAIIFVVTISYIVNRFLNAGEAKTARPADSGIYIGAQPARSWYDGLGEIRVSTKDANTFTVMVSIQLGYEKDHKGIQSKIVEQSPFIKAKVREYFSDRYVNELSNEAKIVDDLKLLVNNIIGGKGIDTVIITEKTVIEM